MSRVAKVLLFATIIIIVYLTIIIIIMIIIIIIIWQVMSSSCEIVNQLYTPLTFLNFSLFCQHTVCLLKRQVCSRIAIQIISGSHKIG